MTNTTCAAGVAGVTMLLWGTAANAQAPGQPRPSASSPAYSPYLNLLRPGSTANNYYGLVRPQIDFQNSVNTLQQQYTNLNRDVNAPPPDQQPVLPTTGHAATFMNYASFYPGLGGNRTSGRPTAATPPATGRR
jgi:hypothetical protein